MGLFKNITTVKLSNDYAYEKQGNYIHRIDRVKRGETRTHENFIVIEKTCIAVLESNEPPPHHRVGEEVTHFIMVSGNEYADRDWAQFMSGVTGLPTEQLTPDKFNGMDSDDFVSNEDPAKGPVQPFRGVIVEMANRLVPLKEKPNMPPGVFTRIKYVREVPMDEVVKLLTPDQMKRFFPGVAAK